MTDFIRRGQRGALILDPVLQVLNGPTQPNLQSPPAMPGATDLVSPEAEVPAVDPGQMDLPLGDGDFAEIAQITPDQLRQEVRPARKPAPLPRDDAEGQPVVAQAPKPPKPPMRPAMKQANPLGPAAIRPVARNAGPEEVAGPLPEQAAPRSPKDRGMALKAIGRLWETWKPVATQTGIGKQVFYDLAMQQYMSGEDHLDGMGRIQQNIVEDLRVDRRTAAREEVQLRAVQDAHARRLGMTPPVYQFYQGMLQSGSPPDEAMLAAAHAMNPMAGWGNLLALTRQQRSRQKEAELLAPGNQQKPGPMTQIEQALQEVVTAGANPATIDKFKMIYRGTAEGQANPKGAEEFAVRNSAPLYQSLHGRADLTPMQAQFVRQYMTLFPTYDSFLQQNGLQDSPQNQNIWKATTGRPVKSMMQQGVDAVGDAFAQGMDAIGNFFGGQQAPPEQQAQTKPRRPF